MSFIIDNTWADWFWSSPEGRSGRFATSSKALLEHAASPTANDASTLPAPFHEYERPIHVLVSDPAARLHREDLHAHVIRNTLPGFPFWRINDDWLVSCPELTFVELAARLPFNELIAVGYEYCGTYALFAPTGNAVSDLKPVTTPESLLRFAERCPRMPGISIARKAARYVYGNSASVMETSMHMRLSLPSRMGGYPSPESSMNHEVRLRYNARRIYKRGSCRFDLYYPQIKLDLEYNGKEHESKMESDSARDAALKRMGYQTMTVTKRQYNDFIAFGEIVRSISEKHGLYVRRDQVEYTEARGKLYNDLMVYGTGRNRLQAHNALVCPNGNPCS